MLSVFLNAVLAKRLQDQLEKFAVFCWVLLKLGKPLLMSLSTTHEEFDVTLGILDFSMFIGQNLIGSPRAFSDHLPTLPYEGMTCILSLKWPVEEKQCLYKPKRGQASRLHSGEAAQILQKKGSKTRPISAQPLCSISTAKSQSLRTSSTSGLWVAAVTIN